MKVTDPHPEAHGCLHTEQCGHREGSIEVSSAEQSSAWAPMRGPVEFRSQMCTVSSLDKLLSFIFKFG